MRAISSILLFSVILFCSCSNEDPVVTGPINCTNLITDTTGTNDTTKIFMVNAFTPNADGINDLCRPIVRGAASFTFTIYDGSNSIIYNGNQNAVPFSIAAPNTYTKYYYKLQVVIAQGHNIGKCGDLYAMSCRPANISLSSLQLEDELTQNGFTASTIDQHAISSCP